ncbi:unnamed protein product [Meloidogyne enterolobii]|uniref:Uncharacterized protein n=1 Tax=Meloidogyne enterolobii TaxID=390850 RepID=A0ACB0ZKI4_MELEN
MPSSINIYCLLFIFSTFLIFEVKNEKCIPLYGENCIAKVLQGSCCGTLSCSRTYAANSNRARYQCLQQACKTGTCNKNDDRCCYGMRCITEQCKYCRLKNQPCDGKDNFCCLGDCINGICTK